MAKDEMCPYSNTTGHTVNAEILKSWRHENEFQGNKINCKSKRVTCPKCGRRMMSQVRFCSDGDVRYDCIPPHKKKKWWNTGKKRRKNRDRRYKD